MAAQRHRALELLGLLVMLLLLVGCTGVLQTQVSIEGDGDGVAVEQAAVELVVEDGDEFLEAEVAPSEVPEMPEEGAVSDPTLADQLEAVFRERAGNVEVGKGEGGQQYRSWIEPHDLGEFKGLTGVGSVAAQGDVDEWELLIRLERPDELWDALDGHPDAAAAATMADALQLGVMVDLPGEVTAAGVGEHGEIADGQLRYVEPLRSWDGGVLRVQGEGPAMSGGVLLGALATFASVIIGVYVASVLRRRGG